MGRAVRLLGSDLRVEDCGPHLRVTSSREALQRVRNGTIHVERVAVGVVDSVATWLEPKLRSAHVVSKVLAWYGCTCLALVARSWP